MKKMIATILVLMLLSLTPLAASETIKVNKNIIKEEIPNIDIKTEQNTTNHSLTIVATLGSLNKLYTSVDIEINSDQAKKINRFTNGFFPKFLRVRKFIPVFVYNLTFTVEYKQNLSNTSKFSYMTLVENVTLNETGSVLENETLVNDLNTKHTLTVENFSGVFVFIPFKLYNKRYPLGMRFFHPAKFIFAGECENFTYTNSTTLIE